VSAEVLPSFGEKGRFEMKKPEHRTLVVVLQQYLRGEAIFRKSADLSTTITREGKTS